MNYLDEMVLFTTKVNEAIVIFTDAVREMAETLNKLFECFNEKKKKEKISVSSFKDHRLFLNDIPQIQTKSLYKPPFIQVPRHLAYQKRHYQS